MVRSRADGGTQEIVRVAFDYQVFVQQSYGGISRYFTRLAQGLVAAGQHVRVFAPLHRNNYLTALPKEVVSGRHVSRYAKRTESLVLAYNHFRSGLGIARWKPDLVHETYYSRFSSDHGSLPIVITVYDMIHELFAEQIPKRDNTAARKRVAIDRADHVICISENTRADLMRLYNVAANKISVVHLGVDQLALQKGVAQPAPSAERPFLLYIGERRGYKNFAGFLKAVSSSHRLLGDFDIVAFGGPRFSKDELILIESMGFEDDRVRQQNGDDSLLGALYQSARALVYPSLYEGFGIPPLEAMAHQCPVISSNASSMPEIVAGAGEYFDPKDVDQMRHSIESVVYSDNRIAELRRAGCERIKAFSWERCTSETLKIYKTLL